MKPRSPLYIPIGRKASEPKTGLPRHELPMTNLATGHPRSSYSADTQPRPFTP